MFPQHGASVPGAGVLSGGRRGGGRVGINSPVRWKSLGKDRTPSAARFCGWARDGDLIRRLPLSMNYQQRLPGCEALRTSGEARLRTRFPAGSGCFGHAASVPCGNPGPVHAGGTRAALPGDLLSRATEAPSILESGQLGVRHFPKHPPDACVAYFKLFFLSLKQGENNLSLGRDFCLCTCKCISKSEWF